MELIAKFNEACQSWEVTTGEDWLAALDALQNWILAYSYTEEEPFCVVMGSDVVNCFLASHPEYESLSSWLEESIACEVYYVDLMAWQGAGCAGCAA